MKYLYFFMKKNKYLNNYFSKLNTLITYNLKYFK